MKDTEKERAFQEGFDADSWDRPQSECPYPEGNLMKAWLWGQSAKRRIAMRYTQSGGTYPVLWKAEGSFAYKRSQRHE